MFHHLFSPGIDQWSEQDADRSNDARDDRLCAHRTADARRAMMCAMMTMCDDINVWS